jgi:hypothetical protein
MRYGTSTSKGLIMIGGASGRSLRLGSLVFMKVQASASNRSAMNPNALKYELSMQHSNALEAGEKSKKTYRTPQANPAESLKRWLSVIGQMTPPMEAPSKKIFRNWT